MRYRLFFVEGDRIEIMQAEDLEQHETRTNAGVMWFTGGGKKELFIYDSRFDFWQQATVNHQDKIRTMGVVRTEYIPPLVRMRHLIG